MGGVKWDDDRFADGDWDRILSQLDKVDGRTRSQVLICYHDHLIGADVASAVARAGWQTRPQSLTVYNTACSNGGGARWTVADHKVLLFFRNGPSEGVWNGFEADSSRRHSVLINPIRRQYFKWQGDVVNPTQKEVWVEKMLIDRHNVSGAWVVVLCAGSATSIIASIASGVNVIAFEQDSVQYDAGIARAHAFMNDSKSERTHVFGVPTLTWSTGDQEHIDEKKAQAPAAPASEPASPLPSVDISISSSDPLSTPLLTCVMCHGAMLMSECKQCTDCKGFAHPNHGGYAEENGVRVFICIDCGPGGRNNKEKEGEEG